MLIQIIAPAAQSGGGNPFAFYRFSKRVMNVIFICLFFAVSALFDLAAHDLVAVTESGKTFVIDQVEEEIEALVVTLRNSGITMADPIVHITGFGDLTRLRDLRFYQVPQIASFDFLSECATVERLVISFARVRNMNFLEAMGKLELLHFEFCGDWESGHWLPFLAEPLDLAANKHLEYLAFRICDLKRVPVIVNVPETLRVLDLSYNAIDLDDRDISALEALQRVERIFINGNKVTGPVLAANKNIVFENSDGLLSEYLGE